MGLSMAMIVQSQTETAIQSMVNSFDACCQHVTALGQNSEEREASCGHPQTTCVMPVMEFKRCLRLWHSAHRLAADMAVSFLMVSLLSIFMVFDLLMFFGQISL